MYIVSILFSFSVFSFRYCSWCHTISTMVCLFIFCWYFSPYPLLKCYEFNLFNISFSLSHQVIFVSVTLSQIFTYHSEDNFCSVSFAQSWVVVLSHSLFVFTDINWTTLLLSTTSSAKPLSEYLLSLIFKNSNATFAFHFHISLDTAALAISFVRLLACSILNFASSFSGLDI